MIWKYVEYFGLLWKSYLKISSDTVIGAAYSNLDLKMNFSALNKVKLCCFESLFIKKESFLNHNVAYTACHGSNKLWYDMEFAVCRLIRIRKMNLSLWWAWWREENVISVFSLGWLVDVGCSSSPSLWVGLPKFLTLSGFCPRLLSVRRPW